MNYIEFNHYSTETFFFLRIAFYTTVSTADSVLIVGGLTMGVPNRSSTIAEYKDGNWSNIGNMNQNRDSHKAITLGSVTMIIGGNSPGGSYLVSA